MSPIESRKPELACACGFRAPVTAPPSGRIPCPECKSGEMFVVGSAHDFSTTNERNRDD